MSLPQRLPKLRQVRSNSFEMAIFDLLGNVVEGVVKQPSAFSAIVRRVHSVPLFHVLIILGNDVSFPPDDVCQMGKSRVGWDCLDGPGWVSIGAVGFFAVCDDASLDRGEGIAKSGRLLDKAGCELNGDVFERVFPAVDELVQTLMLLLLNLFCFFTRLK